MKKKIFFLAFIATVSLTLIQCRKKDCNSVFLGDIRFTQTDLNINPYTGTEKLIYKDSVGDSVCYNPVTRNSNYNRYIYKNPFISNPGDCLGDFYKLEINYTYYNELANDGKIWVDLNFGNPFKENKKYIRISVAYSDTQSWYFGCEFVFDSLKIYESTIHIDGDGSILSFNDSLNIGPNKYYSVYTLIQNNDPIHIENLKTVYYSIEKGVIGFKTKNGHLWYLSE